MSKYNSSGSTNNKNTIGIPNNSHKYIYFNVPGTNKPGLRFNGTNIQFSNDGTTWSNVGEGGGGGGPIIYPIISGEATYNVDSYSPKGMTTIDPSEYSGSDFTFYAIIKSASPEDSVYIDLYNTTAGAEVTDTEFTQMSTTYTEHSQALTPGVGNFDSDSETYSVRIKSSGEGVTGYCIAAYIKIS